MWDHTHYPFPLQGHHMTVTWLMLLPIFTQAIDSCNPIQTLTERLVLQIIVSMWPAHDCHMTCTYITHPQSHTLRDPRTRNGIVSTRGTKSCVVQTDQSNLLSLPSHTGNPNYQVRIDRQCNTWIRCSSCRRGERSGVWVSSPGSCEDLQRSTVSGDTGWPDQAGSEHPTSMFRHRGSTNWSTHMYMYIYMCNTYIHVHVYRIARIFHRTKFLKFSSIQCHSENISTKILTLRTIACFYSVFAKFFQRICQKQQLAKIWTREI